VRDRQGRGARCPPALVGLKGEFTHSVDLIRELMAYISSNLKPLPAKP
jgi:hypothetical protein